MLSENLPCLLQKLTPWRRFNDEIALEGDVLMNINIALQTISAGCVTVSKFNVIITMIIFIILWQCWLIDVDNLVTYMTCIFNECFSLSFCFFYRPVPHPIATWINLCYLQIARWNSPTGPTWYIIRWRPYDLSVCCPYITNKKKLSFGF